MEMTRQMVTDAEVEAACRCFYDAKFGAGQWPNTCKHSTAEWRKRMRAALEAAEKAADPCPPDAELPTAADVRGILSTPPEAPYVPTEPVTITRIVAGFDPGTADEIGVAAWQEAHVTSADFVSGDTRDEDDERPEGCYVTVRLPLDTEIRAGIARVILPTPPEAP